MRDGHLDPAPARLAAVILAGGRARRLGGRDKPMVAVGGVPMLHRVLAAVTEVGAAPRVVVGPGREGLPGDVRVVREEPAGGGPVAAAAAGLAELGVLARPVPPRRDRAAPRLVALLAADLPLLTGESLEVLVRAVDEGGVDGAMFLDGEGRRQLLCGVWRTPALAEAIARHGVVEGASLRALFAGLDVREVLWERPRPPYFDCDTEEDLRRMSAGE
ncbi:NTP transferase domain-containing protein [Dactylosporangium sp. NPDC048998]|uniref:NTP transferase domain-containing protein n=1 Tax=Dactylosporangium sp. NPDC048998 TaxID=3363976 RepID=UPI003716878F